MVKRNVKYQGISIPVPIIDKIKAHIEIYQEYTSVTNFIREAINDKLDRDYLLKNRIKDKIKGIDPNIKKYIDEKVKELKESV
jgi:hypothetical protein